MATLELVCKCGMSAKKSCSVCHAVRYCSEICQKDHWKKNHKSVCPIAVEKLDSAAEYQLVLEENEYMEIVTELLMGNVRQYTVPFPDTQYFEIRSDGRVYGVPCGIPVRTTSALVQPEYYNFAVQFKRLFRESGKPILEQNGFVAFLNRETYKFTVLTFQGFISKELENVIGVEDLQFGLKDGKYTMSGNFSYKTTTE
jgi:hypothetical protein